ncbi:hypothetical protein A2U01_0077767 [Trifolium medium]|uniref:Uncharacterized protein n=1 Tax=Trifolium medium TaxID=97028 RepID=A0A392T8U7_9FABA|nr:hypothetical protein [Trifolium medium]
MTNSRVAPTPERKIEEQGYAARCTEPAVCCTNARKKNCPCTIALRVAQNTEHEGIVAV